MTDDEIDAIASKELAAMKAKACAIARRVQRAKRADWLVYESYLAAASENPEHHGVILDSKPRLKVWSHARKVRVSVPCDEQRMQARARALAGVGKRQAIEGFSNASRRNMFDKLSMIRRDAEKPLFVTLTIPREIYAGSQVAKGWMRALWKRWARRMDCAGLWKLEPQLDGTAHFHLLLWGVGFMPWQKLAVEWSEVITGESIGNPPCMPGEKGAEWFREWVRKSGASPVAIKACNASTRVEKIESHRGTLFYCAKYCAKPIETEMEAGCGRIWGIMGREFVPFDEQETEILEHSDAWRVITWIRQRIRAMKGWEPWIEKASTLVTEEPFTAWRLIK